jgi:hypothetical protein
MKICIPKKISFKNNKNEQDKKMKKKCFNEKWKLWKIGCGLDGLDYTGKCFKLYF